MDAFVWGVFPEAEHASMGINLGWLKPHFVSPVLRKIRLTISEDNDKTPPLSTVLAAIRDFALYHYPDSERAYLYIKTPKNKDNQVHFAFNRPDDDEGGDAHA